MKSTPLQLLSILLFFCFSSVFGQNVSIPDPILKNMLLNYVEPVIDTNGDGEIQYSEAEAMEELILFQNWGQQQFSDPTGLEAFVNLKNLEITFSAVTSLDLQPFIQLESFSTNNTPLQSLDLSTNPTLEKVRIRNAPDLNAITLNNPALEKLEVFDINNQGAISSIDLSNSPNLTYLDLSGNTISSLDLSQNPALKEARLYNNLINFLDLSQNQDLKVLQAINNPLTALDISQNTQLTYLDVAGAQIVELDVSHIPDLEFLFFWANDDLYYVNLKNGNSENIELGEGFYKTPNIQLVCMDNVDALQDYYLVQLSDYGAVVTTNCGLIDNSNTILGELMYNLGDHCDDDLAYGLPNVYIKSVSPSGDSGALTRQNGSYNLFVDEGSHDTSVLTSFPPYFSVNPNVHTIDFTGYDQTAQADFCMEPTSVVEDLNVTIYAHPEFTVNGSPFSIANTFSMRVTIENMGTDLASGELALTYDDSAFLGVAASEWGTASNGVVTIPFTDLKPLFSASYTFCFFHSNEYPAFTAGDVLSFIAEVTPIDNDLTPENNTAQFDLVVEPDSNGLLQAPEEFVHKSVLEGEEITMEQVDDYLHYTISFRNSGNGPIDQVKVTNILDELLDVSTLKITSVSHPYTVDLKEDRILNFHFEDINLPVETEDIEDTDFIGFITYKIKLKNDVAVGDVIGNPAYVYFNELPAVATHKATTTLVTDLGFSTPEKASFKLYPNPTTGRVFILGYDQTNLQQVRVYSVTGKKMLQVDKEVSELDFSGFPTGIYWVELTDRSGQRTVKKVVRQ